MVASSSAAGYPGPGWRGGMVGAAKRLKFAQRGRLGGRVARLRRTLTRGLESRGSRQDRRKVRAIGAGGPGSREGVGLAVATR